jgi:antitoxin ParD1/3/4/toxin ParE1/3/4
MARYALTPAAKSDLAEIRKYIVERGSAAVAQRVRRRLQTAMKKLAEMPGMGHRRDDLATESLRIWPVYSYLIIYRPETNPLQVIRVLHGARDVETLSATANPK